MDNKGLTRVCVLLNEDLNLMIERIQGKHLFETGDKLTKPEIIIKTIESFIAMTMKDKQ